MASENKFVANKLVTHGKTKTVQGTILSPELGNLRLVLVPCDEGGKPSSELHALLNKKWRKVAEELKGWYSQHVTFKLGNIQTTAVQSDVWVIHCLFLNKEGKVDSKALATCVKKVTDLAKYEKASVHVSTLTSNSISELTNLLQKNCIENGICVYYYADEPEKKVVAETIAGNEEIAVMPAVSDEVVKSTKKTRKSTKKTRKSTVKDQSE